MTSFQLKICVNGWHHRKNRSCVSVLSLYKFHAPGFMIFNEKREPFIRLQRYAGWVRLSLFHAGVLISGSQDKKGRVFSRFFLYKFIKSSREKVPYFEKVDGKNPCLPPLNETPVYVSFHTDWILFVHVAASSCNTALPSMKV